MDAGRCLVGRSKKCHVRIQTDDLMSRMHFMLTYRPPVLLVRDIGSLYGTFVNDVKIGGRSDELSLPEALREKKRQSNKTLHDGDWITVGETVFAVEVLKPPFCSICGGSIERNRRTEYYDDYDDPTSEGAESFTNDYSSTNEDLWTADTKWTHNTSSSAHSKVQRRRHIFKWTDDNEQICDKCQDSLTDVNPTCAAIRLAEKPGVEFLRKIW